MRRVIVFGDAKELLMAFVANEDNRDEPPYIGHFASIHLDGSKIVILENGRPSNDYKVEGVTAGDFVLALMEKCGIRGGKYTPDEKVVALPSKLSGVVRMQWATETNPEPKWTANTPTPPGTPMCKETQ